jgi:hypothetical protein
VGVPTGGLHLENSLLNGENRNVKGAATEVKYEDVPLPPGDLRVEAVGDGGGGRLVDNAEDVEAGNNASILQRSKKQFFVVNLITIWCEGRKEQAHDGLTTTDFIFQKVIGALLYRIFSGLFHVRRTYCTDLLPHWRHN